MSVLVPLPLSVETLSVETRDFCSWKSSYGLGSCCGIELGDPGLEKGVDGGVVVETSK